MPMLLLLLDKHLKYTCCASTGVAGVVSVFPCQKLQLQTTRSWDFMGLPRTIKRCPAIGCDIIVGDYVPEYGHSQRALTMKASVLFMQNGKEYVMVVKVLSVIGVPSTRITAYKVSNHISCYDVDLLSTFDHAILDGVDIKSVSIARPNRVELTFDPIAIGAFHAMEKGILTVNAAGNC
ncbi:putative cucumisin [Helianthus anomalus]